MLATCQEHSKKILYSIVMPRRGSALTDRPNETGVPCREWVQFLVLNLFGVVVTLGFDYWQDFIYSLCLVNKSSKIVQRDQGRGKTREINIHLLINSIACNELTIACHVW